MPAKKGKSKAKQQPKRGGEIGVAFRARLETLIARSGSAANLLRAVNADSEAEIEILSSSSLSDWRLGISCPSLEQLGHFARALGVSVDWLILEQPIESLGASLDGATLRDELAIHVARAVRVDNPRVADVVSQDHAYRAAFGDACLSHVVDQVRKESPAVLKGLDRAIAALEAPEILERIRMELRAWNDPVSIGMVRKLKRAVSALSAGVMWFDPQAFPIFGRLYGDKNQ